MKYDVRMSTSFISFISRNCGIRFVTVGTIMENRYR